MNPENKEQIYDSEISPLMAQIIAICQKHKISMFATYDIPNQDDEELCCSTCTADDSGKLSERIRKFNRLIETSPPLMLTTERADGSKTMIAILG